MKAATIRIYSTCPASGNAFVRIASHDGLGLQPLLQQQFNQLPYPTSMPQANLWPCDYQDQVQPGGGRA